MKKTKIFALVLCVMLIAVTALSVYSCEKTEGKVLGKGKTSFKLEVVDDKGERKIFTIKTDEKTLESALLHDDVKLIALDEYGMISTVDGLKADFFANQTWWNIVVDDKDSEIGASQIEINKESVYKFVLVKEELSDDASDDTSDEEAAG